MRDAVGGSVSIYIIMFFLALINGYLAYSVNYTKAFRVKNRIVSIIEEQEGFTASAKAEIEEYVKDHAYYVQFGMTQGARDEGYECFAAGYCVSRKPAGESENIEDEELYRGWNYQVRTFVNIDIPVINKVLPAMGIYLNVEGETRPVYAAGNDLFATKH